MFSPWTHLSALECMGSHSNHQKYSHADTVLYCFFCGQKNIITFSPLIFKILGYKYLLKSILYSCSSFTPSAAPPAAPSSPVWSAKSSFCVHFLVIITQCQSSLLHISLVIPPPSPVPPGELDVLDRQAGDQHTTIQPYTAQRPPQKTRE